MPEPVMLVVLGAAAGAVGTGAAGRLGERIVNRVWPERNATEPSRVVAVQNAEAMSIVKSTGPALVNSIAREVPCLPGKAAAGIFPLPGSLWHRGSSAWAHNRRDLP